MKYYSIYFDNVEQLKYVMSRICVKFGRTGIYSVNFIKEHGCCYHFIIDDKLTFLCITTKAAYGYFVGLKILGSYSIMSCERYEVEHIYNWMIDKYRCDIVLNTIERAYIKNDIKATADFFIYPQIEKVIFNNPATIVFWSDGSKTVVKAQDGEIYDPEKGLVMAITKKWFGNKGNYYNNIKKWLPKKDI